ncbi:MAG: aldehyde dehydrogenase family protein [Terriglobia bacterium]
MPTPKLYKNYINGAWVEARCGKTFENLNPADKNDLIGLFPASDQSDLDDAVAAAKAAYNAWRVTPAPKRAEILFRAAQMLVERKEELARDMTREMGKVLKETRGDVQEAIDMGFYMAGEGRRQFGFTTPCELPNKFGMCVRQPLGVCGMITPWNFPMAIPSWKIFPALVCGNTVVFKPASATPLSAYNFVKIVNEAGLPRGVLNLVTGSGSAVGTPLMTHPEVSVISFTGSTEVGRSVSVACAPDFRHCHLEMGGKNIILVMDDARLDLAVDGALWGGFGTAGQRCTAASRVAVHKKVYKQFLQKFLDRTKSLQVGNGLDPSVEMGPLINDKQRQSVHNYVEIGQSEGAKLLCGGAPLTGGDYDAGAFYAPTIFADCDPQMRVAQEEIFGPVVSVLPFDTFEQAIEIANGVVYGLSASIYSQDVNRVFAAMRDLYTGIVYINAPTVGAEIHLPFGGAKQTGNGHREAGIAGLDVFSEWKSIYVDFSGTLQRAQIDTHPL